jgi:predicted helicase
MTTTLRDLLTQYRAMSENEYAKGLYFERLVKVWLENAPTQAGQFSKVMTYGDWAKEQRLVKTDTGVDLVAQLADSPDDWCAVQCKFYATGHHIQKPDLDTFLSASGKRPFTRRMFVDTTGVEWGKNALATLEGQNPHVQRIGLYELENSGIDWDEFVSKNTVIIKKKKPRPDQDEVVNEVVERLATAERGKLIMACGTGKTFTALQIAQRIAGRGGRVLFLVPSLSLMSQTIREWSIDANVRLRSFAVCSDVQVGITKAAKDDLSDMDASHLEIPATTNFHHLAAKASKADPDRMTVVFSTYQSIQAVSDAQHGAGLPAFDIIICDEAHRTTGATLTGEDESNFVKVHDGNFLKSAKRLYMTATPRVFAETVKKAADEGAAVLCSMDDESLYGETLYTRNFGWAVQNNLLTDYKVIVLAVDLETGARAAKTELSLEGNKLTVDDATRMVGCYKALTKADFKADVAGDTGVMRRALMFAKSIETSQQIRDHFPALARQWRDSLTEEQQEILAPLQTAVRHVDGTMQANQKNEHLAWIKEDAGDDFCRILTNARCLTEGVDVPALDAIMFMHPRKSQIDVVQAVGRVMRKAPGKELGYVIVPVIVPNGVSPEEALDNNEAYKVVWEILNALRSHDERLGAEINKISLGVPTDRIQIISGLGMMGTEVGATVKKLPSKEKEKGPKSLELGDGVAVDDDTDEPTPLKPREETTQTTFDFDEYSKAIMAKIVKKCGTRTYWENWASDVAKIAERHIIRITAAVEAPNTPERAAFEAFVTEIRDDLNDSITEAEAIEMLAQHLITKPVFDALFEGYEFAKQNPVSVALEGVLAALDGQHIEKEAKALEGFYASVRTRAAGINEASAKQKIVVELYEKFFKSAFPKLTQRMGIVYTPVEVVDFIIHSVEEILNEEFGQSISDEGVHVIDPFTGTGTFITRLLQSGLIKPHDMARKFREEIHANEIVLLAYYIAAINIEAVFHDQTGDYEPFPGICLTDTFQLYEKDDLLTGLMEVNSGRRTRQKNQPIQVIIGNPPYSVGQNSANDNAANVAYPSLDARIAETYAARSKATNKNALYDSYIRAIRWASDRLDTWGGVVGFVTNAGWLDANTADGLRRSLADEFTRVDVFNLRGNQRTQGEQSRREGGKIFGQGSRTPVAITFLSRNKKNQGPPRIYHHDIGDYLSREQKLAKIAKFGSLSGITSAQGWETIAPDQHGDWLNQRDDRFDGFIALDGKSGEPISVFESHSMGVKTQRDAWAVNPSPKSLAVNMATLIRTYEQELLRFQALGLGFENSDKRDAFIDNFVDNDPARISWSANIKGSLGRGYQIKFDKTKIAPTTYRPFSKQHLYYDRTLNERVYQMPRIFPYNTSENSTIALTGSGTKAGFTALMLGSIVGHDTIEKGQCFPRYLYTPAAPESTDNADLFTTDADPAAPAYTRTDAITDAGLAHFQSAYPGETITKDDLFHFTYGILHSEDYRARYADNLSKQLPRLPILTSAADFWAFVDAGARLGEIHVNYESVEPWPVTIKEGDLRLANIADPVSYFRVEKMKYGGKRPHQDKTTVIYNPRITITNIPLEAYDYVVNGKSALDWVIERQCVKIDPASGIVSDANAYANETVGDPRYPLDLFCRVITVAMETIKIVNGLPKLSIREG